MIKPNANLKETEELRFVVQVIYQDAWMDANWIVYTNLLKPWEQNRHRIKGIYGMIGFTDASVAKEAANAIKSKYPERLRVIQRIIIIEETYVGEV